MNSFFSGKLYRRIKIICPAIHFLLTFLFERKAFHFENNFGFLETVPMSDFFSNTFELIMCYVITKLIALVLILLLWRLFFAVIDRTIPLLTTVIFSVVFIAGMVVIFILWPYFTLHNYDNYMLYAYAVRFVPEYWHSIYSGCFMGACLMVFPNPFTINIIEWLWFVAIMGYIYHRIGTSRVISHGFKYIVIGFFLLPFIHTAVTDSYRSELYALFSLFFFTVILLDAIEKRTRTGFQLYVILVGIAVIAVWRSEGIILGAGMFLCVLFTNYVTDLKKSLIRTLSFLLAIIVLRFPSFVGTQKYYGDDYSFINYMDVMQTILNSKSVNLNYDGVEEDLEAIDCIVDLEALKEHGTDGYRRFNYANGRRDINQSTASGKSRKALKKAYKNLVIHNPKLYYMHQANCFCATLGFDSPYALDEYSGVGSGYGHWSFDLWDVGLTDYFSYRSVYNWEENATHYAKACDVNEWFENYELRWKDTGLFKTFNVLIIVLIFAMALYEFIRCILCKKLSAFFILSATLFALVSAIAAVMPTPAYFYLRTYCYCSLLLIMIYFPAKKAIKRSE